MCLVSNHFDQVNLKQFSTFWKENLPCSCFPRVPGNRWAIRLLLTGEMFIYVYVSLYCSDTNKPCWLLVTCISSSWCNFGSQPLNRCYDWSTSSSSFTSSGSFFEFNTGICEHLFETQYKASYQNLIWIGDNDCVRLQIICT